MSSRGIYKKWELSKSPVFARRVRLPGRRARFATICFVPLALFFVLPAVSRAHLDLVYPDGPVTFYANQVVTIKWDVYIDHGPGQIKIELSTDGGATYSLIVDHIPYSGPSDEFGSYDWTVPSLDSSNCKLRVTYYTTTTTYYNGYAPGENNPTFTIAPAQSVRAVFQEGKNSYPGTRDATIYAGVDYSDGGGQNIFAGENRFSAARRALIAFDLSAIPGGSTITSATLQLTVSKTATFTLTTTQTLHRLTKDWGEGTTVASGAEGSGAPAASGDATWFSNFFGTSDWTTAGGDYVTTVTASAPVSNTAVGNQGRWTGPQLVRDLQDFVDGAAPNHGWILIGDESGSQTAMRYYSSEDTTGRVSDRPELVVVYKPPPPSSGFEGWVYY